MKLFYILYTSTLSVLFIFSASSFAYRSEKESVLPSFSVVNENLTKGEVYQITRIFYSNGLFHSKESVRDFQEMIFNNYTIGRSAQKIAQKLYLGTPFNPASAKVVIQFYHNVDDISSIYGTVLNTKESNEPIMYFRGLLEIAHTLPFRNDQQATQLLNMLRTYSVQRENGIESKTAIQVAFRVLWKALLMRMSHFSLGFEKG